MSNQAGRIGADLAVLYTPAGRVLTATTPELAEQAGATSIATACTEVEAVQAAHERIPGIIFSDVKLLAGTGPRAVQTIMLAMGKIPVVFITGTPDACPPCEPPNVILSKPIDPACVIETFRRLAPL